MDIAETVATQQVRRGPRGYDRRLPAEFSQAPDIEMIKVRVTQDDDVGRGYFLHWQGRREIAFWPENKRRHAGTDSLGKHGVSKYADTQEIDQDRGMAEHATGNFGVAPLGGTRTRARRERRTPSIKNHLPNKFKASHGSKGIESSQKSNRDVWLSLLSYSGEADIHPPLLC